ncbi:Decaprenyl diphosphate synthase-like [Phytophthora cactorum]|nr:Decaprenyl diphosphate synthase-like [Phytophthora cactorum]
MSRPSSSSSSTWTQCSDANWTMTRKSDTAVLQPPALSTLRNWCKASFQWCVKALTLFVFANQNALRTQKFVEAPRLAANRPFPQMRGVTRRLRVCADTKSLREPVQKPARAATSANVAPPDAEDEETI